MATIKISEMPSATTFEDDDYAMIVQSNNNKKITKANLFSDIEEEISDVGEEITTLKNGEVYSTTEVKTNKKWINNKPIYRTVVAVNFGNSGTTRITTAHNIVNIDEITHYELRWYDTTDSCWYCNYKDVGTQYYIYMGNVSKTNVMVFQNSYNWQNRTSDRYCTIEYTKTTD